MKVAIETRAGAETTGVGTYVRELVRRLPRQLPGATLTQIPGPTMKAYIPVWMNHVVPRSLDAIKPDIVHFTKSDVPRRKRFPTVVTIYDVIPLQLPKSQSFLRRLYWPRALRRAAQYSDHILTISEASKRGIIELLHVPAEKITVTPLAVDTSHFKPKMPSTENPLTVLPAIPYILFVGRWDIRKNIPSLIAAFARIAKDIPHQLVIAGRPADQPVNLPRFAREAGVADRVIFKQDVPFNELPALYAAADLFVYPSIIEGWGFPPQEAMACGTPVIVSDGDPLPEIMGNTGHVVPFSTNILSSRLADVEFISNLAVAMKEILGDAARREQMSKQGLLWVKMSAWDAVAAQTAQVYAKVAT